ncbi:MAG: exodeoxyribonuclease VII large subunit [Clostridia bacterium]|nr:exodeoxyribonuclease VII large subunit [Clostridia bacterium]
MSFHVLTVSQINNYIKSLIEGDNNLRRVFVSGEISNFNNNYRSGHLYFSLKEGSALIKAVIFSSNASRLRFRPCDGMKVIVSGRVSLYSPSGQYQLYVDSMQPDGVGDLALAYEQLKEKLLREGLFDQGHKLPIPVFPKKIGVITSATGAVIQDIKNVVSRRCPMTEIILCPAAVQGELAPEQLVKAVRRFNSLNNVDVIIIGRGGGSFEDLNCFNDEALVRAIYASKIPVISAVGHETDYTLCDFAADLRAPTPSAAAELAVVNREELIKSVERDYNSIERLVRDKLLYEMQSVDKLNDSIKKLRPDNFISDEIAKIGSIDKTMKLIVGNKLKFSHSEIKSLADKVNALNPINLLNKGYSIAEKDGKVISSVESLSENDMITLKMSDGALECEVRGINNFGD